MQPGVTHKIEIHMSQNNLLISSIKCQQFRYLRILPKTLPNITYFIHHHNTYTWFPNAHL